MEKVIIGRVYDYLKNMKNPKENVLELLLVAQKEAGGTIPHWLQVEVSDMLQMELEEIKDTVEFFPFLKEKNEKPVLSICMGSSCFMGGNSLNAPILQEKKGNLFEVEYRECDEACEYGPRVIAVNKTFQFVDENTIDEIISYIQEDGQSEKERGFL